jgi:hypothetical protein
MNTEKTIKEILKKSRRKLNEVYKSLVEKKKRH